MSTPFVPRNGWSPDFLDGIPQKILLGWETDRNGVDQYVVYGGDLGLFTVAPNRTGKGSSAICVNGICHRASFILCEPKGESCNEMGLAWWRHDVLGQTVHVIDPLHVVREDRIPPVRGAPGQRKTGQRTGFNPVAMIAASKHPVADTKMVTRSLITIEGNNPFFSRSSSSLFAATMAFVALDPNVKPQERTTRQVWKILSGLPVDKPKNAPGATLKGMLEIMSSSTVADGFVSRVATDFLSAADETLRNVLATLRAQAGEILDDPHIMECLSGHSVDFGSVQREPVSIFVILPGWASNTYANFFRMLLSCMFKQIEYAGLPPPGSKQLKTLIILDELATLGKADFIKEALPRLPGYGVQFWPFVQDLGQIADLYGSTAYQTFLGNAGVTQAFGGSGDPLTTEVLSKRSGTVAEETVSTTDQRKGSNGSQTTGFTGRPAIFPYEIETMNGKKGDELKQLLFYAGKGHAYAQRLRYYVDFPDFMGFLRNLDRVLSGEQDDDWWRSQARETVRREFKTTPSTELEATQPTASRPEATAAKAWDTTGAGPGAKFVGGTTSCVTFTLRRSRRPWLGTVHPDLAEQ